MMSINNVKNEGKNSSNKSRKSNYRGPKDTSFADILLKAIKDNEKPIEKAERKKKVKSGTNKNQKNTKNVKNTRQNTVNHDNKGLDFSKEHILRTLNAENKREGDIVEIYDDGIKLKIGKSKFFVSKDIIEKAERADLSVGERVLFDIDGKDLVKIERNKLNIKSLHRSEFRDGIYEGVVSSFDADNSGYEVSIGKIGKDQEDFFLEFKDMITKGQTKVGDVVSLDIKEKEKEYIVKEFYLKEGNDIYGKLGSEFILTPQNYKMIKWGKLKGGLSVKLGHYSGIVFIGMLPEGFKNGDSLKLSVKSVENTVKKTKGGADAKQDTSIDRKYLRFSVVDHIKNNVENKLKNRPKDKKLDKKFDKQDKKNKPKFIGIRKLKKPSLEKPLDEQESKIAV